MTINIKAGDAAPVPATSGQLTQIKTDLGLEQVDNTADMNKPVSTAQAAAIAAGGGGSGGGVTTFVALTDKTTADIPTINAPVATALAGKPNAQAGALSASTTEAATPTAVINHVSAALSALVGTSPSTLNTLQELATAIGNDPAFTTTINGLITTVGNSASLAQSTATSAATLAATKATAYPAVTLGTSTSFTVNAASNADRANYWSGSSAAVATYSTVGALAGQQIPIANIGSATITMAGVGAAAGYKLTIGPSEVGGAEFQGGAWLSLTPSTTSNTALAVVTPATGSIGTLLTCTPAAGWTGTFLWMRDGSAEPGPVTTSTYTIAAGDAGHAVSCQFTPTFYATNSLSISALAPGQVTSFAFNSPADTTLAYSFVAPSSGGTPTSYNVFYRTPPSTGGYIQWGGHSGTSLSGTITGLSNATTYEGYAQAVNSAGSGTASATATATTTNTKITFTDAFPEANGAAPNARWTQEVAGWTVQSHQLQFDGIGSVGFISAACTAGNNTIATDLIIGGVNFSYPTIVLRWVDGANFVYAQLNDGYPRWEVWTVVTSSYTNVANGGLIGTDATHGTFAMVGNTMTLTFTGGTNAGNFSVGSLTDHTTATRIALGRNTGHPTARFANVALT